MATKSEVANVDNDNNTTRPANSGSDGLDVPQSSPAYTGNGPNITNFKREKEFSYNGSAGILNNSMDPSGNSSPTKHNVRANARPNVNMHTTSPNNGPVPGGTMNPQAQQASGPAAPNVDPFSEGVNLPPDAMMNKTGGMAYNMGPGAGGDAYGSAGSYGYGRNPSFAGMTNQMQPNSDMYQGPAGPNPSNPMSNTYGQFDPMNRNFNPTAPVSRGFVSPYGQSGVSQPRAPLSQRPPSTDRMGISSSAPTLSQLLQGQKPQYNFPIPQNDVPGRGPEHGGMPNQYWGGQPRINSSMASQMPVGYPNRSQMSMQDNHMLARRSYGAAPGMVPGAPPYSQQSMPQYNRQYPQMYTQQMHRPPVSRGIYAPQVRPPPYGPQSQGMNFGPQQQPGQTPTGFGSHVQQQSLTQGGGGTTPPVPSGSAQPSMSQQPPSSLAGPHGMPHPQPTSQPSQPMTSQGQVVTSQGPPASQQPSSIPQQQPAASQQVGQMMPHQGRSPMGQQGAGGHPQGPQMSLQGPALSQQGPVMPNQGPTASQPGLAMSQQGPGGMPQPAPRQTMPPSQMSQQMQQAQGQLPQGYSPMAPQQQQGSWQPPPQQAQRSQQQDVPSSQPLQPHVKQENVPASNLPAPAAQPGQVVPATQDIKPQVSRIQGQENAGNRPSSLPDLSGCLDDLATGGDASSQSTTNSTPAVNNQTNRSPAAATPPAEIKLKTEPGSRPSSQPPTPTPQPPPTQPPAGTGVIKPSPSPVGSPASLVSRTSQSPASAHSGSVTPQPQMPPGPPGGLLGQDKGMDRLSQSPSMQHNDMKGSPGVGGYNNSTMPPPYGGSTASTMPRYPNHASPPVAGYSQAPSSYYQQSPYGSPGNMVRPGYRGGMPTPYGNSSAMGNMSYDNRIRPGMDPYVNSQQQQQCNDYNPNNSVMGGPGPDPAAHPMRSGGSMNMNAGNPFPTNYTGGGGPPGGGMGYKPMMPIPQRLDGPYGPGGPNAQRFGMRGMHPSAMAPQNMMPGGSDPTRHSGSYPPPYPAQQQQWPQMQQQQQMANSHHGPSTMPQGGPGVPHGQMNNSSLGGPQQTSTAPSTTQGFTGSSTATSTTVISTVNSASDTRNTMVTQSITMPVTTVMTVTGGRAEHLPMSGQAPVMAQIIKKENEDGMQQIKMEANISLPALPQGLNQPSPMASPSTLSKSSQEDVTSGTASPCPPSVGTPTPRPASQGNVQQQPQKKTNDVTTSNGLVLNRKVMKLYELSDDPNRKIFLDTLLKFMDDRQQPIKTTPQVASHILDLFRLYYLVKEKGGVVKVSKTKQWKTIASTLAIGNSNSAAYTLKKNYIRYLLPYDCYFDRNNLDPAHIIAEIDTTGSKKDKKKKAAAAQPGVVGSPMFNNVPYDQYGPRHPKPVYPPYPNQMHMYPQQQMSHPRGGPMPANNSSVPQMPNNMGNNITVRDPFSEMDNPHMPPSGNPPYNSAYGAGGPMVPGQYRPPGAMINNDMYNQGPYGDMRNSGGLPPGNPPDPYAAMGRRDMPQMAGGKPEAFNRAGPTIPPPSSGEPFPNSQSGPASMGPGATQNSMQQFQQGSHDRPFVPPSPGSNPPQPSTPVPPISSAAPTPSESGSNSSSSTADSTRVHAGGYRFPTPNMGARAPAPNTQSYPPPPYSGGATGPYGDQQQPTVGPPQQQQPQQQQGPPMAQTPPQAPPTSRFTGPNSSPFPSKRLSESFSPAPKRQDTMGPQPGGHMPPDGSGQMPPNMPPYSQPPGFYPDGGDRPHPPGHPVGHPHGPGHPGGYPFGPRSSQPGPMPPHHQGMRRDGHPTSDPMGGMHPGMPWPMKQPPRSMPPSGMRGPPTSGYSGPGTLQTLLGNYPRERYQPSSGGKPSKLPSQQLPTMSPLKKEVVFPPDSIEASQPKTMKVKLKTGKDVGSVEFWRVMMALKSGLLAESTWALDILSVLLYDDSTVVSFDLRELKGLLELLVDYYRAVLKLIFGGFQQQNRGEESQRSVPSPPCKRRDRECEKKKGQCDTPSKRRRTEKRLSRRTTSQSDLERLKGVNKSKLVKLDPHARNSPLTKFYSQKDNSDSEREHWSMKEALPLRIIHQLDDATEANGCLSQKYVRESGEDEDWEEWQRYCSEELMLVKGHIRQNSKTTKLVYTSQYRQPPDDSVVVLEDEELRDDIPSMITKNDAQVAVSKRCKCISNILRGLSFIPANAQNLAGNSGLLALLGRLLLLDHSHGERQGHPQRYREYQEEEESSGEGEWFETREEAADSEEDPISRDNWSLDCLNSIREDALVILNNISGQLDFALYQEAISLPILDGLLHWSVCLSASALDPFPLLPANSPLSPKRLSIEALAKLSLKENNVDMILATPPFERLERLFGYLTQYVGDRKEPVLRELAIVLLSSLAQEEMLASRSIACQKSAVSFLLCYLEDSEYARSLEKDQGAAQFFLGSDIQPPNNSMMRRATSALASLAKVPENHPLFLQHQTRLLNLSMSPLVDRSVRELIAEALFHLGSAGS